MGVKVKFKVKKEEGMKDRYKDDKHKEALRLYANSGYNYFGNRRRD